VVKVVPKKIVQADEKAFDAKPVGSGPYALVSATREDKIVFRKYAKYNGRYPAKAASMTWNLLSDASARVSAMESGRVEAIEDVPYIDMAGLKRTSTVESAASFGNLFLMFNCAKKPFDDPRVRQALHYALDTEKIIATAMSGQATAASGYLQPSHPDYVKASTVYGHDPARARELLKAAGVSALKVTALTTDTSWVQDIAPLVKESWDAAGVRTTLDIGQSSAQYAKIDTGDYDLLVAPGDPSVFGNDVDLLVLRRYLAADPLPLVGHRQGQAGRLAARPGRAQRRHRHARRPVGPGHRHRRRPGAALPDPAPQTAHRLEHLRAGRVQPGADDRAVLPRRVPVLTRGAGSCRTSRRPGTVPRPGPTARNTRCSHSSGSRCAAWRSCRR
jgi:hypothetical protein